MLYLKSYVSAVCVSLVVCGLSVSAARGVPVVVYDGGAPTQQNQTEMAQNLLADTFTLNSAVQFDAIRFWSFSTDDEANQFSGSIAWTIYANGRGQPGTALASGLSTDLIRNRTGKTRQTFDILYESENLVAIGQQSLTAGTYWLSLHNGPSTEIDFTNFFWEWSVPGGSAMGKDALYSPRWEPLSDSGTSLAYQLVRTPEPASLAFLLAAAPLALTHRRLRK